MLHALVMSPFYMMIFSLINRRCRGVKLFRVRFISQRWDVYKKRVPSVHTFGDFGKQEQIKTNEAVNASQARKTNCANNRTASGLGVCFGFKVVSVVNCAARITWA